MPGKSALYCGCQSSRHAKITRRIICLDPGRPIYRILDFAPELQNLLLFTWNLGARAITDQNELGWPSFADARKNPAGRPRTVEKEKNHWA
jgi:hypothetical protein